jgi:hypothetical protein
MEREYYNKSRDFMEIQWIFNVHSTEKIHSHDLDAAQHRSEVGIAH